MEETDTPLSKFTYVGKKQSIITENISEYLEASNVIVQYPSRYFFKEVVNFKVD